MFSSDVQFENSIVKIPQKILSTNDIITDIFVNTFKLNYGEITLIKLSIYVMNVKEYT